MMVSGQGRTAAPTPQGGASADPMGQIGDLLRQFTQGQGGGQPQAPAAAAQTEPPQQQPSSGGFGDILGQLQKQLGGGQPAGSTPGQSSSSNPLDMLGQIFGQATQGVQEGAGRVGQATGMNEMIEKMSGGRSPQELLEQLQKYMGENQLATGATLGGLGALILGTQTGRSVATSAAKIGALALIGGLAYKAYQNYSQGKPLIAGGAEAPAPAPQGSGFEASKVSNDGAQLMIRAMIAAAAADGRIDATEQQKIIGNLAGSGLEASAEQFLASELNAPASIEQLAAGVTDPQQAIKVYTAARIAIDPDTQDEQSFLSQLGQRLGLDQELMAHIDAQARAAAA